MNRAFTLLAIPLLVFATACTYGDDDYYDDDVYVPPDAACDDDVVTSAIDADAALEVAPAEGVGVFVEYQSGGRWIVYTSCDTDVSGYDCLFDVVVRTLDGATISAIAPDDLERQDRLELIGADVAQLESLTARDFDGFSLDTEPGAALSVDVLLDEGCGNSYVYWIGDGAIHEGAPSAPLWLEPNQP